MTGITEEQLNKWHDQAERMAYSQTVPYAGVGRIWVQLLAEVRRLRAENEQCAAIPPGARAFIEHFFAEKARGKPDTKDKAVDDGY